MGSANDIDILITLFVLCAFLGMNFLGPNHNPCGTFAALSS